MNVFYQNRLPHVAPVGATFFVTFRQADALPQNIVQQLREQLAAEIEAIKKEASPEEDMLIRAAKKRYFGRYERQLDDVPYGTCHLRRPEVAEILIDKVREYDGSLLAMQALCVMPNHVHMLFSMAPQLYDAAGAWRAEMSEDYVQLDRVMQLIKGGSARHINQLLGREGERFWAKDSYDHFVRDEGEWLRILRYILENPVKAKLVSAWGDWPHTLVNEEVLRAHSLLL